MLFAGRIMRCPKSSTWAALRARWCLAIRSTTGCRCGARGCLALRCWPPGFMYSREKITDMGTVGQSEKGLWGRRPQVPAKAAWPCLTGSDARAGGANRTRPRSVQRCIWILLITMTACNSAETGRTTIDSTLAALVPPDATMLAGLRMSDIRGTHIYQKMLAGRHLERLDEFARQTGFDPRRDVRELLVASNGKDSLVAARGTFNVRAFEGMTRSTYKSYTLYTRDRGGVALIDNSTAIA